MSFDAAHAAAARGVVIIGAGQAGGRCIEALRQNGFTGDITLIGEEPHLPYERPPLSKEMLGDEAEKRIAWVRPAEWYADQRVTLRLGVAATRIDRAAQTVALSDGGALPYGILVLATGTRPRPLPLPGADHAACQVVRTLEDSRALLPKLAAGRHIVVIGAGFIGLEVAAAARARGAEVTVLELAPLPMARCIPAEIAEWYVRLHENHGVKFRFGASASSITDDAGRAVVHVGDDALVADAVVIGIGVIPNTTLAADAGLAVQDGIVVDARGRTEDERIYAAGDVTRHFNPLLGRALRLETWQNAQNQAITVARNILGTGKDYAEIPWFWSDQFGHNMQIAGLPGADDEVVARGTLGDGPALRLHLQAGRMVAAIGIDAARDLRFCRELIALGAPLDAAILADPATKFADLFKAAKAARAAA